ncbi:hypothetical protein [Rhodoplanes sp. Z2-YC6860]|uniref:hypothetical protein n=1 Tax=Rhodoplanes sp. Z2-YC6860 TaxID=674703 RepID=UPI0012EE69BA|nr:hypothetical protein [Rhodoplanes sp. Z2-YC6860]
MVIFLTVTGQLTAHEVLSSSDEQRVLRDFSQITLANAAARDARAFFDVDKFVVQGLSAADNSELRKIARDGLSSRLHLVSTKDEANLLVQIRMGQRTNFAIRNPKNAPSQGYVMVSLCRYPIKDVSSDCENLQYDYFHDYRASEIFSTVFQKWLATIFIND